MRATQFFRQAGAATAVGLALCWSTPLDAQEMAATAAPGDRLEILQHQINEHTRKVDELRDSLAQLQQALDDELLANARARGAVATSPVRGATPLVPAHRYAPESLRDNMTEQPVGQAPES